MKKLMKHLLVAAVLCVGCLAHAVGYQLYSESSTEALAVGGAVIGFTGNISNAWYNPATITSFDRPAMMFGATGLLLGINYDYEGGSDDLQRSWRPTGYGYGIIPMSDSLTLGLSINAPYGMITEWENDWKESYMATYTNIRAVYFTPTLAWRINDEVSVAAGVNLVTSMARLARNMPSADGRRNKLFMHAEDPLAFGFTLAAFYQPHPDWGIGLHYQSRVKLQLEGGAEYRYPLDMGQGNVYRRCDVGTDMTMPSSIGLGLSNTSLENWRFGFSVNWSEWSTYDVQEIWFDSLPGTTGVKGKSRSIKDWDDSFSFRLGAEYTLNDNWILRTGYMYDMNQENDKYRTPEIPDSDRNMVTFGVGYRTENWGVDLTYGYVKFDKSKIGTLTGSTGNGTFKADVHIVSIAVSREF